MKRQDHKSINSHTLWLEFLNQRTTQNVPYNKSKQSNNINLEIENSKSFYKTQEEYYDENMFLKKTISALKGENEILKSKIRQDEEELTKKNKEMNEFINCLENNKSSQDSSVNNFIAIKKLKQSIFRLKSELKTKESEILNLKSDVKYTNINEMKIQNEVYLQEVKSLQQLICNINSHGQGSKEPHSVSPVTLTKSKSSKVNGKSNATKKHKEIMMENKMLKKEIEKMEQVKMSSNDDGKINSTRKDDDLFMENDRLKRACKEINHEKNELQIKYDELSSKLKKMSENLEQTEAECNSLKRKGEQKSPSKSEVIQTKPDKIPVNEREQNQELIQSVCRSYINREKLIQNLSSEKAKNDVEDLSNAHILSSALVGYAMRQKIQNLSSDNDKADIEDLSKADIFHSAFMGYTMRQKILNK